MSIEFEGDGPLIKLLNEDYSAESCNMSCGGCDPVIGMSFARYTGLQDLAPGKAYAGRLVCHGLRTPSDAEVRVLELLQRPSGTVCDIEIQYIQE